MTDSGVSKDCCQYGVKLTTRITVRLLINEGDCRLLSYHISNMGLFIIIHKMAPQNGLT